MKKVHEIKITDFFLSINVYPRHQDYEFCYHQFSYGLGLASVNPLRAMCSKERIVHLSGLGG